MKEIEKQVPLVKGYTVVLSLVTLAMFLAFLSPSTFAQDQSSNEFSGKTGIVTGDQVRLRGGPGTNYKEVGRVDKGETLQIQRSQEKWFQVAPPAQASVWIYGEYMKQIDSTTGKVTGTDVNVRPLPREQSNVPVGQVSKPAKVNILDRKKTEGYDQPWYQIQMPEGLSPWIHSKFVNVDSEGTGQGDGAGAADTSEPVNSGSSEKEGGAHQKGGGTPQKGGDVQKGGGKGVPSVNRDLQVQGASKKWQDRLIAIQEEVQQERSKENKLRWDFLDQIKKLDTYIQECPNDQLVSVAEELRSDLKNVQENVRKQRKRLNQRLREIKEERKKQVRNSIQDVLEAKGFSWDVTGYVKSVGGLYAKPPAEYELVKGKRRIYFLTSGRNILKLKNYRGLQVAISGKEQPVKDDNWDAPIMEVMKIEVVR